MKQNLNHLNKLSGVKKINSEDSIYYFDSIISNLKNIKIGKSNNQKDLLSYKHTKFYSNFKIDHIKLIFFKNYPNKFYICRYDLSECEEKTFKLSQIGNILSQTYENNSEYKYIFVTNNFKNYSENQKNSMEVEIGHPNKLNQIQIKQTFSYFTY